MITDAKSLYFQITGLPAHTIVPIHGGLNSTNYLINGRDVLRVKTPSFDRYYDPKAEYLAETLVAPSGLAPQLFHFDQTTGNKLTRFIEKTTFLSKPPRLDELTLVAQALRKLHALSAKNLPSFQALERYDLYKRNANIISSGPREDDIRSYIANLIDHSPLCLCHNDLVRGNILFHQGAISVIDYEYAGVNHPLFDLASFITENNISDESLIAYFLKSYYQEKNIPRRDFDIFCRFLDYLWYYWAQGMYKATGQSVFKTIARLKWGRIKRL